MSATIVAISPILLFPNMTKTQELLATIDVRAFYSQYFPSLPDRDKVTVHSPFRKDNNPSFLINLRDGSYHDFGDDRFHGKNILEFYMQYHNVSGPAAFRALKQGMQDNSIHHAKNRLMDRKKKSPQVSQRIIKASRLDQYNANLYRRESGFADFVLNLFRRRRINLELCKALKIGTDGNGNIVFPFRFDEFGNVTNYKKVRYYVDGKKRIITNAPKQIYLENNLQQDHVVFAAGELDALALNSWGIPAVTFNTGESSNFKPDFSGKQCTIIYDYDTQGRNGAEKLARALYDAGNTVSIVEWNKERPDGFDVCAFLESGANPELLMLIIKSARLFQPENESVETDETDFEELELFDQRGALIQLNVARAYLKNYPTASTEKHKSKLFFEFNGFWREIHSRIVRSRLIAMIGERVTDHALKSIMQLIVDLSYVPYDRFNAAENLLNLRNGVLDVRNLSFVRHSKEHYFTYQLDYDFNPEEGCRKFTEFLNQISLGDPAWKDCYLEILGYCLTSGYEFQKMFWFLGSGGNGKGLTGKIIRALLGNTYSQSFSLKRLTDPYFKSSLIAKRVAISGETALKLENIPELKSFTGGDMQSTDVKYQEEREFVPTAKLILMMNRMPTMSMAESIQALERRIVLLPFDYQATVPDHSLDARLISERSGILNLLLLALHRLFEQGDFSKVARSKTILDTFFDRLDTLSAFVEECLDFEPDAGMWAWEAWELYQRFMNYRVGDHWTKSDEHIRSAWGLGNALKEFGVRTDKEYCKAKSGSYIRYTGIKPKPDDQLQ